MQDNNILQYYMVVDEKSTGPYSIEEVLKHPALTPDTLVWKPGIENWVAARTLPELSIAFIPEAEKIDNIPPNPEVERPEFHKNPYYQQDGNRYGQYQPQDNPAYREGNPYGQPPYDERNRQSNPYENQYGPQGGYGNQYGNQGAYRDPYGRGTYRENPNRNGYPYGDPYYDPRRGYRNGYERRMHTNWLPWAIVATVLGLCCSCIGAIFGIIGIIQANKANTLYARDLEREGDNANSNAKVMTIIGLCLAGLGIIIAFAFRNVYSF